MSATPLPPPTDLRTERLHLRPFRRADADAVQAALADARIANQTVSIPHPYPPGGAIAWIGRHAGWHADGRQVIWAITTADVVVGAMGLTLTPQHRRAEVGYWIAQLHWGQGIATEALRAVLAYGFDVLGLHRIEAHHFSSNPASGRVMQKAGMSHEGRRRGVFLRDGVPRDNELYAMLATDPRA